MHERPRFPAFRLGPRSMAAVLLLGLGACAPAQTNSGTGGAAGMAGRTEASGGRRGRLRWRRRIDRDGRHGRLRRRDGRSRRRRSRQRNGRHDRRRRSRRRTWRGGRASRRCGPGGGWRSRRCGRNTSGQRRRGRPDRDRRIGGARRYGWHRDGRSRRQRRRVGRSRRRGRHGGQLPPPVRDTASKVPISSASGYTVEGNYPYGPLTAQRLDVIYPSGAGPKGTKILPAVLMFHGGAWIHSYTNNYGSGKDHMSTFFNRFLAHGFIVFNAEYRVNDGTADGAPAPAAVEDALARPSGAGTTWIISTPIGTKYVVTGASAGGHLALMVAMTTPGRDARTHVPDRLSRSPAWCRRVRPRRHRGRDQRRRRRIGFRRRLPNRLAIAKLGQPADVCPQGHRRRSSSCKALYDNTAPVADSTSPGRSCWWRPAPTLRCTKSRGPGTVFRRPRRPGPMRRRRCSIGSSRTASGSDHWPPAGPSVLVRRAGPERMSRQQTSSSHESERGRRRNGRGVGHVAHAEFDAGAPASAELRHQSR